MDVHTENQDISKLTTKKTKKTKNKKKQQQKNNNNNKKEEEEVATFQYDQSIMKTKNLEPTSSYLSLIKIFFPIPL